MVADTRDGKTGDVSLIMSMNFTRGLLEKNTKFYRNIYSSVNQHNLNGLVKDMQSLVKSDSRTLTILTESDIYRVDPFVFADWEMNNDLFFVPIEGEMHPEGMMVKDYGGMEYLKVDGKLYPRNSSWGNLYYNFYMFMPDLADYNISQMLICGTYYYATPYAFDENKGQFVQVNSYSDGYVSSGNHTPSSSPYSGGEHGGAYSGRGLEGTYSGRGLDSANTGLEVSALTPASYGATGGNGGQQVAGGYGNGYAADYAENDGWLGAMKNITRLSNDIIPPSHPLSFSHYPLDAATSFLIMSDNKEQMEREKQGRDYYYHPKATCEAAQLGGVPAAMSLGWGVAKEGKDMLCKTTGWCGPKMGFGEALSDSIKDMKNNWRGVKLGLSDRETPCSIQVRNNVYDPYKRR